MRKNLVAREGWDRVRAVIFTVLFVMIAASCGAGQKDNETNLLPDDKSPGSIDTTPGSGTTSPGSGSPDPEWYKPKTLTTWQIQLQGEINTSFDVAVYDVDLFDTPDAVIKLLHSKGSKVICYFSAGTYEDWRDDAPRFKSAELGSPLADWPGERWLDIRSSNVLDVMKTRMDIAAARGCDGVDPDNMDGYTNNSGFPLTAGNQEFYNKAIAEAAHERKLAVGLKNDLDQIEALVPYFDFAVNEQCHQYNECELLAPFIAAKKPVFNIEYGREYQSPQGFKQLCQAATQRGFRTLVFSLALDGSLRQSCDGGAAP